VTGIKLSRLLEGVEVLEAPPTDPEITGLCYDSRRLKPGDCFVAIAGTHTDGHRYVETALRDGAVAAAVAVPVSIDTYKAQVAERALAAGATLVNDVWGLRRDPAMAGAVAHADAPVILMHHQPGGGYRDLIGEIAQSLLESVEVGRAAGIRDDRIILDPGIGFGKTREENLEIIRRLPELRRLGFPLMIGPSRKSFIGKTLDLPAGERLEGTAAAVALSIAGGADIVRVHDVKAMVRVARMADAIRGT